MLLAALVVFAVPLAVLVRRLIERPQRGVLLLAALIPFDGLLLLLDGPDIRAGWKEALVVAILAATFVAPRSARPVATSPVPAWVAPTLAIIALSVATAYRSSLPVLVAGLKVDHFYLLLVLAIWRCPLDRRDRDRLVTILMATAVVTSAIGVAQQLLGGRALNAIGYEFNTVIRTTGDSVLRSFSTFEQPFPFAFYVVFVMAVTVPVALQEPTRTRNQLFLWSTPILLAGVVSAVVRAALVALAVAALYHLARNYRAVLSLTPVLLMALALAPYPRAARELGDSEALGRGARARARALSRTGGSEGTAR